MTVKGGTTPACAACKYQRRKCSPNCPLAPYFPANQPKMFQNVHRLFGVSNVTKTLEKLHTKDEKDDAMRSIIYEADMRERFPVDGCCAVLAQLQHQLQLAHEEMQYIYTNLEVYRDQMATNINDNNNNSTNNNKVGPNVGPGLDSWFEFGSSSSNDAYGYSVGHEHYGVGHEHFFLDENSNGGDFCTENVTNQLLTLDLCKSSNLSCDSFGIQKRNTFNFD